MTARGDSVAVAKEATNEERLGVGVGERLGEIVSDASGDDSGNDTAAEDDADGDTDGDATAAGLLAKGEAVADTEAKALPAGDNGKHNGAAPPAPYVSVNAVVQAQHCVHPTTPLTGGAEQKKGHGDDADCMQICEPVHVAQAAPDAK